MCKSPDPLDLAEQSPVRNNKLIMSQYDMDASNNSFQTFVTLPTHLPKSDRLYKIQASQLPQAEDTHASSAHPQQLYLAPADIYSHVAAAGQ